MDKLQELTDRLYNEGLSRGREEGEALLQKAREQAEVIIAEARKTAEATLAKAEKEAEDLKLKTESDLRKAASQALQATKKDLENIVVCKISDHETDKVLSAPEFVKEIITAVAQKFSADEAADLDLVLPESLKDSLEPFVANELGKILGSGVTASFSKKIAGGFTVGPKDGSYFISLTDDSFKSLISEYLRPATKKLLFG